MARSTGGTRDCRRGLVALALLVLCVLILHGQEAEILIEPGRIVRGAMADIRIRTSIPWGAAVDVRRPELDESLVWIAYPTPRSWIPEGESEIRLIEVLAKIQVTRSGIFPLGSFRIRSDGREVVTPVAELIGLERDEAELPYPVFLEWRTFPEEFWQGQAIPIVLEARNLVSLTLADATTFEKAPAGLLEEAHNLGSVQNRQYGEDVLYDVPIASWIWTVNEQGSFDFPAVRASVGALSRRVEARTVNVLPLPEEAQDSSAVGRFKLDVTWNEGPYSVGDIVSVRVRASGVGNLNVLKLPTPELESAILVGGDSSFSYVPTLMGYEGWREEQFDFQIDGVGDLKLVIPGWIWLDPEDGLHEWAELQALFIALDAKATRHDSNADLLLGARLFHYRKSLFHWRNAAWAFLYLPGFLVLVISLFFRRMGKLDPGTSGRGLALSLALSASLAFARAPTSQIEIASRAAESARLGDWETAATLYAELEEVLGEDTMEYPGLLHDVSIVYTELEKPDMAMASIRRAMFLRPGARRFEETLDILEDSLGLSNQVPPTLTFLPAFVFIPLLLGVNGFFFSLAVLMFRKGARAINLFVLCTFFLLSSLAVVSVCDHLWNRHTAGVKEDSKPLRKIPGPLASDWIQLPPGEMLSILAFEDGDCLVRTGYGLEGWLPRSSLIVVSGRYGNEFRYDIR